MTSQPASHWSFAPLSRSPIGPLPAESNGAAQTGTEGRSYLCTAERRDHWLTLSECRRDSCTLLWGNGADETSGGVERYANAVREGTRHGTDATSRKLSEMTGVHVSVPASTVEVLDGVGKRDSLLDIRLPEVTKAQPDIKEEEVIWQSGTGEGVCL
ncbi:hypothetical protein E2C01_029353 [Portunus trituberculatus]|uniref:Uncharacterized protein n=1 Tax=Portunus trituberculatus TaxID=210409 RepID=A0A5B7EUE0_PORTR|nr:hypothetical protein [Portunus trituberculatus]